MCIHANTFMFCSVSSLHPLPHTYPHTIKTRSHCQGPLCDLSLSLALSHTHTHTYTHTHTHTNTVFCWTALTSQSVRRQRTGRVCPSFLSFPSHTDTHTHTHTCTCLKLLHQLTRCCSHAHCLQKALTSFAFPNVSLCALSLRIYHTLKCFWVRSYSITV